MSVHQIQRTVATLLAGTDKSLTVSILSSRLVGGITAEHLQATPVFEMEILGNY
jgi:hypothetical protein